MERAASPNTKVMMSTSAAHQDVDLKCINDRLEAFALEVSGKFEIKRGLKQNDFPPWKECIPPILLPLEKLSPVIDFFDRASGVTEHEQEMRRQQLEQHMTQLKVTFVQNDAELVLTVQNWHRPRRFEIKTLVSMTRKFSLSLRPKDLASLLTNRETLDRGSPNQFSRLFVSPLIWEAIASSPDRTFRMRANLPTINDNFDVQCSERAIGEPFLNDYGIRDCILKLETPYFSAGHWDLLDKHPVVRASIPIDLKQPAQLAELVKLTTRAIDFLRKNLVIA